MTFRHRANILFRRFERIFNVLEPPWAKKLVGTTTDGASNMTGSHRGAVTFNERACLPGFYRAWCGLHQLDLEVQRAVSTLLEEEFYSSPISLTGYLRRQMAFVEDMKATCLYSSLISLTGYLRR
jgi:hypothetical protein